MALETEDKGAQSWYHALYWSLYTAFHPSGTLGGGGPGGGAKSAISSFQVMATIPTMMYVSSRGSKGN
jgi:hypothetical protein